MDKLDTLRQVLVDTIVPASAMRIGVESWENNSLTLSAPLDANINDKGIGFAGSIYSLAVLCGWGTVFQTLADNGISCDIAVYQSSCDFSLPALEDMKAGCTISKDDKVALLSSISKKGRGRIELTVDVYSGTEKCSSFSAKYAVRPKNSIGSKK